MIVVRLLRDGNVVRETLFRELPVRLGRSPDCEFPLLDDSVSHRHAQIEAGEDGVVMLRDLDSRNGVHVGPHRISSVPVDEAVRCRLGRVELEIAAPRDTPTVEVKIRDLGLERRRSLGDQLGYLLLGVLGWLGLVVADPSFWSPWDTSRWVRLLGSGIAALILLPLFSAVWLVALKAFGRKLRMADTLQAFSRLPWLWLAVFVVGYLAYYPLSSGAYAALHGALTVAATAIAVVLLVSVRRLGPSRLFNAVWAAVAIALFVSLAATWRLSAEKMGQPELDFHVQQPLLGWAGRSESLDSYFARVSEAAEQAGSAAKTVRVRQGGE